MNQTKKKNMNHDWHLIDAKNKILGRLSSEVAMHLMGKNKATYVPNLDTGDFVVVINAQRILLSGNKETKKKYYRHSGYPGGLHSKTAAQIKSQSPQDLIRSAIYGMLPKTKLGRTMIKKLYIFPSSSHPYQDKFKD